MHTEERMAQARHFYEDWCDGKMLGTGAPIGPNSGTNWDFSRYEECDGFQLITLSSDRQTTIVLCDNSHRHHPYASGYVEIPWSELNADEALLEREKRRLLEMCQEQYRGMNGHSQEGL